jgi:hypothetical protein
MVRLSLEDGRLTTVRNVLRRTERRVDNLNLLMMIDDVTSVTFSHDHGTARVQVHTLLRHFRDCAHTTASSFGLE